MAEEQKQLSPEEKLLQSLHEGEEESPDTAATLDASAGTEEKPKLKLAKPEEDELIGAGEEESELIGAGAAAEPAGTAAAAPVAAAAPLKRRSRTFGISTVNWLLSALVLGILCLAAFEVWSSVTTIQIPAPLPDHFDEAFGEPEENLPPLDQILKSFEQKRIFRHPDEVEDVEYVDASPRERVKKPAGAIKYAKENLDLIGLSGKEAIVVDRKSGKMHILKVGDEVDLNEQKLKLQQISADQVEFSDGNDSVMIK